MTNVWRLYRAPDHHCRAAAAAQQIPKGRQWPTIQTTSPTPTSSHLHAGGAWDLRSWLTRRPAQWTATGQSAPFIPSGETIAVDPAPLQVLAVSPPLRYSRRVMIPSERQECARTGHPSPVGERVTSTLRTLKIGRANGREARESGRLRNASVAPGIPKDAMAGGRRRRPGSSRTQAHHESNERRQRV